jgi:cytochrome P450
VLAAAYPGTAVAEVATRADSTVFGPGDPSEREVEQYWTEVDVVVQNMARSASWWKRVAAAWSLRSLLRRARERRRARRLRGPGHPGREQEGRR